MQLCTWMWFCIYFLYYILLSQNARVSMCLCVCVLCPCAWTACVWACVLALLKTFLPIWPNAPWQLWVRLLPSQGCSLQSASASTWLFASLLLFFKECVWCGADSGWPVLHWCNHSAVIFFAPVVVGFIHQWYLFKMFFFSTKGRVNNRWISYSSM